MTTITKLLQASIDLIAKDKYIARLEAQNEKLRREIGRYRLLEDLRADARDLALPNLLRPQI